MCTCGQCCIVLCDLCKKGPSVKYAQEELPKSVSWKTPEL